MKKERETERRRERNTKNERDKEVHTTTEKREFKLESKDK